MKVVASKNQRSLRAFALYPSTPSTPRVRASSSLTDVSSVVTKLRHRELHRNAVKGVDDVVLDTTGAQDTHASNPDTLKI